MVQLRNMSSSCPGTMSRSLQYTRHSISGAFSSGFGSPGMWNSSFSRSGTGGMLVSSGGLRSSSFQISRLCTWLESTAEASPSFRRCRSRMKKGLVIQSWCTSDTKRFMRLCARAREIAASFSNLMRLVQELKTGCRSISGTATMTFSSLSTSFAAMRACRNARHASSRSSSPRYFTRRSSADQDTGPCASVPLLRSLLPCGS
mmetsp:Transcript_31229/g.99231  ORF Transcript_31229/g.99231 Transcript_31229/m.99231 type:complete len:203 (+) Transcript_31229:748-1356(+)